MISLYTETLGQLLENQHYGEEDQSSSLTEILELMAKIPNFNFDDEETLDLNFTTLFMEKYDIREIGAETEELFMHHWRETTNEILIKYVSKINMWIEHFNELFLFKVTLNSRDENRHTDKTTNTYYLNPINKSITDLKVQDVDENNNNGSTTLIKERDVLQSVWGKTRPHILAQILDLKDIYLDCLEEFESIFMGVF